MPKAKYDLRYLPLFYEELNRDVSHIAIKLKNPDAANNLLDSVESAIMKRLKDGPESFEQVYSRKSRKHPYDPSPIQKVFGRYLPILSVPSSYHIRLLCHRFLLQYHGRTDRLGYSKNRFS